jgi:hypothetical protein
MRLGEFLPWIIATIATLLFVTAVVPQHWSARTKHTFRITVAAGFFFSIGAYWLTTGEKFDETVYRFVLCRVHSFERCSSISREVSSRNEVTERPKSEIESLTQAIQEIRRQQEEAAEVRKKQEERAREKAEADAAQARLALQRQEEDRKKRAQDEALKNREASGDTALANARQYWGRRNLKVAAEYSEQAITIWTSLPNANEPQIQDKIASAHSIVGLSLALLGATPKDQAYGCGRLDTARQIYVRTGNTPMVSHVDQNKQLGRCSN